MRKTALLVALAGVLNFGNPSNKADFVKTDISRMKSAQESVDISVDQRLIAEVCLNTASTIVYTPDFVRRSLLGIPIYVYGDYWQTPEETARTWAGDCEDMAIYLEYTLNSFGIRNQINFGRVSSESSLGHMWNEAVISDTKYLLDPTCRLFKRRSDVPSDEYIRGTNWLFLLNSRQDYLRRLAEEGNGN